MGERHKAKRQILKGVRTMTTRFDLRTYRELKELHGTEWNLGINYKNEAFRELKDMITNKQPTQPITLSCFNSKCDKTITFQINRLPKYSFDLVNIAQKVGWIGEFDFCRRRSIVFCSKECEEAAKTKNGNYKLRG